VTTPPDSSPRRAAIGVRAVSILAAIALALWAFSEDPLIGGGEGFGWAQAVVLLVAVVLGASSLAPLAWNARVLALVVSTGLTLALAELPLRRILGPRYYAPFELDESSIYRLSAGATREFRLSEPNGAGRVVYHVNSAGFRGEELDAARRSLRIAVYGDSFIQAEFSPLAETFVERLEQQVAERTGAPVEAVNAGVAGYGPDQTLRKMEHELVGLAPDLVLLGIFAGNDFGDLLRNKMFRIDAQGALQENAFELEPAYRRQLEISRKESFFKVVSRQAVGPLLALFGVESGGDVLRKTAEAMTPAERVDYFLERSRFEYEDAVVQGNRVVSSMTWDSYSADVSLTPGSESARYKVALMDAVIGRIRDEVQAAGMPLALVLIPSPIDVCGHETGSVDREKYREYRPRALTDAVAGIAQRRGIPYVDLFGPFDAHCAEGLFLNGLDDHWSARGQELAAQVVAERLAAEGLLKAAAQRMAARHPSKG
jgi:hypothetical protein